MLTLIFILLVVMVSLTAVLWAGTFMFQGYIYTEPSAGIAWQAPAVAGLLTVGYTIWVMTIAFWPGASVTNIPINAIHRFSPNEDMLTRPAKYIWAIKLDPKKKDEADKDGVRVAYTNYLTFDGLVQKYQYKDAQGRPWQGGAVIAIEIENDDKSKMRLDKVANDVGDYNEFVSADGWAVRDYAKDGLNGMPVRFRFWRLLLNIFFNAAHFAVWFVGLWLLLRFQMLHALGLAFVMWLIVTLTFLPMMLGNAAEVAASRQVQTASVESPFADGRTVG